MQKAAQKCSRRNHYSLGSNGDAYIGLNTNDRRILNQNVRDRRLFDIQVRCTLKVLSFETDTLFCHIELVVPAPRAPFADSAFETGFQ